MTDTPSARLAAELRAAGVELSDTERQRLLPVWEDNLERRSRLRSVAIKFEEAPFERFGDEIAQWTRNPPSPIGSDSPPPQSGEPWDLTLSEQSTLLASGDLSAVELTDAYLRRIAEFDDALRAFVTVDGDGARRMARQSDQERADGKLRSPLHGIPIAVKDMIAVAGLPLTAGSRLLAGKISAHDADVVSRLRDAGVVLLGTNTLLEFGTGSSVRDGPYATGRNPWDPARIPGGSSSGSAVAVAAGLSSAAIGTDSAGSIRMPATFSGLVGLKTTRGLVSLRGVVPFCWTLDSVGTLTRCVEDAALMLESMASRPPAAGYRCHAGASVRDIRLGVLRRGFVDSPDVRDDVRAAFEEALDVLRSLGVTTHDVELPTVDLNDAIYTTFLSETYALHAATLRAQPEGYNDWVRTQLYAGALVTADDLLRARRLQGRLIREAMALFERIDAFVLPGLAEPAPPFGASLKPALTQPRSRFTRPWSITGFPALSLPCGVSREGLPLSVHLAARPFDEALLIELGSAYQRETGWHRRRPDSTRWIGSQEHERPQTKS